MWRYFAKKSGLLNRYAEPTISSRKRRRSGLHDDDDFNKLFYTKSKIPKQALKESFTHAAIATGSWKQRCQAMVESSAFGHANFGRELWNKCVGCATAEEFHGFIDDYHAPQGDRPIHQDNQQFDVETIESFVQQFMEDLQNCRVIYPVFFFLLHARLSGHAVMEDTSLFGVDLKEQLITAKKAWKAKDWKGATSAIWLLLENCKASFLNVLYNTLEEVL
jgi:hypothetical protein